MNKFLQTFNLSAPIVQGPMSGISGPDLVAAVTNAGALGILPIWSDSIRAAEAKIKITQTLTNKPFAVNLRADLVQTDHITMALDKGINLFHLFWGDPEQSMPAIRDKGARLISTVSDKDSARAAIDAGASALIAQGIEAGGHVIGTTPTKELLAIILDISDKIPVIAAGGCATNQDVKELMDAGASGVLLGTRFVVSHESEAHSEYQQAIIDVGENDTVRSLCFDLGWADAPHRTLKNATYEMWNKAGQQKMGQRSGEDDVILTTDRGTGLQRYHAVPPAKNMTGVIEGSAMYAGTGADKISAVASVEEIIGEFR